MVAFMVLSDNNLTLITIWRSIKQNMIVVMNATNILNIFLDNHPL